MMVAKIPLGDQSERHRRPVPTTPLPMSALPDSIAVIGSRHDVSRVIPVSGHPRALKLDADGCPPRCH